MILFLFHFLIRTTLIFAPHVESRSEVRGAIRHAFPVERALINTPLHQVNYHSHFDLTFTLHNEQQEFKLTLEPNHDILAETARIEHLDRRGNIKSSEPIDRSAHMVFKGSAWIQEENGNWENVGWARIYLRRGGPDPLMEGAFSIMNDIHHVQLESTYMKTKRSSDFNLVKRAGEKMIVYRDSDMNPPASDFGLKRSPSDSVYCGTDQLDFNADPNHLMFSSILEQANTNGASKLPEKRQSDMGGINGNIDLESTIGSTTGCPTEKKVAPIGIATDCTYTSEFGSREAVQQNIISMVNTASNVFERSFNIILGIQKLSISEGDCPSPPPESAPWNMPCASGDLSTRLRLFSTWRASQEDNNAYWSLLSTCPTGNTVGVAWIGQLCVSRLFTSQAQTAIGANVVVRTPTEWQVFAHESGHTFGAVHDCDSATCPVNRTSPCCPVSTTECDARGQFIMSAVSTTDTTTSFSQCTIGNVCSAIGSGSVRSSCLVDNRNIKTATGPQCGNGIVEEGEDCDCGSTKSCPDNPCCNPLTCKFMDDAVCSEDQSCCSGCQFISANTTCRASTGPCDIEEVCTGTSASCPANSYQPDGQSCGDNTGLSCARGYCTSRNHQCQSMMNFAMTSSYSRACNGDTCTLSCSSASDPFGYCEIMNQYFLDGSPCMNGGRCSSGECQGASTDNVILAWIKSHMDLVIGLAAGLGTVLLVLIAYCTCGRRRGPRSKQNHIPLGPMPQPRIPYYR